MFPYFYIQYLRSPLSWFINCNPRVVPSGGQKLYGKKKTVGAFIKKMKKSVAFDDEC